MCGPLLAAGCCQMTSRKVYYKKREGAEKMAQTEAQLKASRKYHQEKLEEIKFRVPKGDKSRIVEHAQSQKESTNAFIYRAINETIERDMQK